MTKRSTVLACMLVVRTILAMDVHPESDKKPFAFRVMTFNVCHPAEIQKDPALKAKFAWSTRKDGIFRQILQEDPDIIGFQEIRDEDENSSVADLWDGLGRHGYNIVSFPNNASPLTFINAIAYKKNKLFLNTTSRWWASDTPDVFSDTWGPGWGRLSLMLSLFPIIKKKIGKQIVPSPDYEQEGIHFVNIHNGLTHTERLNANKVLVKKLNELVQTGLIVVSGDFNCFPDDGGADELDVLKTANFQEALSDLKTADGVPVSGTFVGYSYDRFRSPKGKIGTQLDHIFVKPVGTTDVTILNSHVSLAKRDGSSATGETEAELLTGPDGSEVRDEFSSDHAAGVANLAFAAPASASKIASPPL